MQSLNVRRMVRIGLCAAFLCVCAWIAIPSAVPYTMQSFAVLFAAALLPAYDGVLCVAVYLLLGSAGLPVFSGMRGGFHVLAGPTGGFLFGFFAAASVLARTKPLYRTRLLSRILCMIAAQSACYLFGVLYFALQSHTTIAAAASVCVLPYLVPDMVKILLAAILSARLTAAVRI